MLSGLQLGFVYALIALGYTMVYGIVRLINFAHGDVFMVGAFVSYYAVSRFQPAPVAGLAAFPDLSPPSSVVIGSITVILLSMVDLRRCWRSPSSGWPTSRCATRRASRR